MGLPGIDDADGADADPLRARRVAGALEILDGELPARALVEVVGDLDAAVERDRCGVERVLRDGDEDPVVRAGDEEPEHGLDGLARAVGQVDRLRVGVDPVALADEGGDRVAHEPVPLALGVGAEPMLGRADRLARDLDHVGREGPGGYAIEQLRVLREGEHLAHPRERPLPEGLRVPDVAVDDLSPLALELLRAGDDGAADGVLRLPHERGDVFDPDDHRAPRIDGIGRSREPAEARRRRPRGPDRRAGDRGRAMSRRIISDRGGERACPQTVIPQKPAARPQTRRGHGARVFSGDLK